MGSATSSSSHTMSVDSGAWLSVDDVDVADSNIRFEEDDRNDGKRMDAAQLRCARAGPLSR